jgi:drug/metabolite transporter (DMT)-like permease
MTKQRANWIWLYLLVGSIWGCSFLFIAIGNQFLTPVGVSFWRLVLGGIPLLVVALAKRLPFPKNPAVLFKIFLISLCMNSLPGFLFAFAEQHVSSSLAGIMNATTPIATIIMILTVFREETPSRKVLVGLGIGLIGVMTVLAIWDGLGSNDPLSILALIAAVTLYGIGGPYARRHLTPLKLNTEVQVSVQVLIAAISLLPFYLPGPLFTAEITPIRAGAMLVFGVLGTGYAYVWYYQLMNQAGSAIANSVTYLSPVVAVLVGATILSENVTWNELVGGAIVIFGAAVSQGRLDPLLAKFSKAARQ